MCGFRMENFWQVGEQGQVPCQDAGSRHGEKDRRCRVYVQVGGEGGWGRRKGGEEWGAAERRDEELDGGHRENTRRRCCCLFCCPIASQI